MFLWISGIGGFNRNCPGSKGFQVEGVIVIDLWNRSYREGLSWISGIVGLRRDCTR